MAVWGWPVSFSVLRRLPGSLPLPPQHHTAGGDGQRPRATVDAGGQQHRPAEALDQRQADTSSMAAWIAVTSSSPPDGFTVRFTGTVGSATPPPM
jgi:hypothetical protein